MSFVQPYRPEWALARLHQVIQGKYRIRRLLGIGGSSAVYAATHRNGHEVAIKFLLPHLVDDEDVYRLFRREAYVANRVGHPGAVPVLDDDVDEQGSPFLIMPLLEGETLRARWKRSGNLPLAEACVLVADTLDVLASAHAKGIVHRDIKPENLFLTRTGDVRVMDFGIARRGDVNATFTLAGRIIGTPAFMPPEQAVGDTSNLGPHSDGWAVGATLFYLLSGETVHVADTAGALLVAAATRHARPLASVAPDVPAPVAAVVDRALAFEPEHRWASARDMRDALLAALESVAGESIVDTRARVHARVVADLAGTDDGPHDDETQIPKLRRRDEAEAASSEPEGRMVHCGDGVAVAQFGALVLSVKLGGPLGGTFNVEQPFLADLLRDRTVRIGWLCILGPNLKPEEESMRRAAADLDAYGDQVQCAAVVILGDGLQAEMNRSTFSGMAVVLSHRMPAATFSSTFAALQWLVRHMALGSMEKVERFVDDAIRQLELMSTQDARTVELSLPGGRLFHAVEGFATGQLGRVYVSIWEGGSSELVADPHIGIEEAIRSEPDGIALLCIVGPGAESTESSTRRLVASLALHSDGIRCVALVYDAEWAANDFSERIHSGVTPAVSNKLPIECFFSISEAISWMGRHVPLGALEETVARVEQLRSDVIRVRARPVGGPS